MADLFLLMLLRFLTFVAAFRHRGRQDKQMKGWKDISTSPRSMQLLAVHPSQPATLICTDSEIQFRKLDMQQGCSSAGHVPRAESHLRSSQTRMATLCTCVL